MCITMVNDILVFGPDGKIFFCAINFLGSWLDGTLTEHFSSHIREQLAIIKFVLIRASHGVAMQLGYLFAQFLKGLHVDCRLPSLVRDNLIHLLNVLGNAWVAGDLSALQKKIAI